MTQHESKPGKSRDEIPNWLALVIGLILMILVLIGAFRIMGK